MCACVWEAVCGGLWEAAAGGVCEEEAPGRGVAPSVVLQNEFCSLLYRVRVQGGEDS